MTRFDITFKPMGYVRRGLLGRRQEPARPAPVTVYGDGYHISDKDSAGYSRLTIFRRTEGDGKNHVFVCNAFDVLYTIPQMIDLDED